MILIIYVVKHIFIVFLLILCYKTYTFVFNNIYSTKETKMIELKDLIKRAFRTLVAQEGCDIDDLEIEMFFNDKEPVFDCYKGDVLIKNKKGDPKFSLKDLIGLLKYNMTNGVALAFGGLNSIVNAKVKSEAEKRGLEFEGISLVFISDEVNHNDFRVVEKGGKEEYLTFKDFN